MDTLKPVTPVFVALDRRIEVIGGSEEHRAVYQHMSDIREVPIYVLLGEPGMGKSSVLRHEAYLAGVELQTARTVSEGGQEYQSPLIIDALDEYRMDGNPADKAYRLANGIKAANVGNWRLSCRAEDWRKEADIAAIKAAADGQYILVVQLLPLDNAEARKLLSAFGEADPERFLEKARSLGAEPFTENPLILRLLHKAVSKSGTWPSNRFELFQNAIQEMAHEENTEHRADYERTAPATILDVAEQICLRQLLTGAAAIVRTNAMVPGNYGARTKYLSAHDLGLNAKVLRDTLDTSLFRGEGEFFEPFHKVGAEFLAGRALAKLVVGWDGRPAIPFSRALALITADDGLPPTELRGFYAWFAAHLAKLGDAAGALKLIENDPFSVLAYGDASVVSTEGQRTILANLGRDDPYFRVTQGGTTSFGGLAQPDLADDFNAILLRPDDSSHTKWTIFEALIQGQPLAAVRPTLRQLVLDPQRGHWERQKALEAWLNGSADLQGDLRRFFEELSHETSSLSREVILLDVITRMNPERISTDEMKIVLSDFERRGEDRTVGRLYSLQKSLERHPRVDLFEAPFSTWRNKKEGRYNGFEMTSLLDAALASAIRSSPELGADQLYQWVMNSRDHKFSRVEKETASAIQDWLQANSGRSVALFDVILANREEGDELFRSVNLYYLIAGGGPPGIVARHYLELARGAKSKVGKRTALKIAAELALAKTCEAEVYWEVYYVLSNTEGCKRITTELTRTKLPEWRLQDMRRAAKVKHDDGGERQRVISLLTPISEKMKQGDYAQNLSWFAELYFGQHSDGGAGIEAVAKRVNDEILASLKCGSEHLARNWIDAGTPAQLGTMEAESRRYFAEYAALAGLGILIEEGRLPDFDQMPLTLAIVAFKSGIVAHKADQPSRISEWAVERLNLDPAAGAQALSEFYGAILQAGYRSLPGIEFIQDGQLHDPAFADMADDLLARHRTTSIDALRSLCLCILKRFGLARLLVHAEAALADPAVVGELRKHWTFLAFLAAPARYFNEFVSAYSSPGDARELRSYFFETFSESALPISDDEHALRHLGYILAMAPGVPTDDDDDKIGASMQVRHLIDRLAQNPSPKATQFLQQLSDTPSLSGWSNYVRHAQAVKSRIKRDADFKHPTPAATNAALKNGPPLNPADLRAVVVEELNRLSAELRTSDTSPWKRFWNSDQHGAVTTPLIENECRDYVLERLRDRLKKYDIVAAVPEAQSANRTRADMLFLSHASKKLPIEVKRHYHSEVWTAAATQLRGYSADLDAEGLGIYLVIWFGTSVSETPARPDGRAKPTSAAEMESLLRDDLPTDLNSSVEIIVFDVSRPAS